VHGVSDKWPMTLRFVQQFNDRTKKNLTYGGESPGASTNKAILMGLSHGRIEINKTERTKILEEQKGVCQICNEEIALESAEFDHILAVSRGGLNNRENLRALCQSCHRDKTSREQLDTCPMTSHLCPESARIFGQCSSSKPAILAIRDMPRPGLCVDVIKCRTKAFEDNIYEYPVYCPLDRVVPATNGLLFDYSYVDKGEEAPWDAERYVNLLPYQGPRFYHRAAVEFLLTYKKITWDDIKLGFQASAHLKADFMARSIQDVRSIWESVADERTAKEALNAAWGVMSIREHLTYSVATTDCGDDVVGRFGGIPPCQKDVFELPDGMIRDYIHIQTYDTYATLTPIHQMCLDLELVRVAQALHILYLQGVLYSEICELRTDAVYVCPAKKKEAAIRDAFASTEQHHLCELKLLRPEPRLGKLKLVKSTDVMTRGGGSNHFQM